MSESEGRRIAENILKAASQLNTHPEKLHEDNDPYYWEPEYPDEDVDSISMYTVLSHNIHYAYMTTYNLFANIGYRILDFFGYNGSDYDWIQRELDNEKDNEEYERREQKELEEFRKKKEVIQMQRKQNNIEMGTNVAYEKNWIVC